MPKQTAALVMLVVTMTLLVMNSAYTRRKHSQTERAWEFKSKTQSRTSYHSAYYSLFSNVISNSRPSISADIQQLIFDQPVVDS